MSYISYSKQCELIAEHFREETALLKSLPPEEAKKKAHDDLVKIGLINEDGTLTEPYKKLAEEGYKYGPNAYK